VPDVVVVMANPSPVPTYASTHLRAR